MRVLKFGGSSLASVERFLEVAGIVKQQLSAEPVGLVLSAPQGVTNLLVELTDLAFLGTDYLPLLQQWQQRLETLQLQAKAQLLAADNEALTLVREQQFSPVIGAVAGCCFITILPGSH